MILNKMIKIVAIIAMLSLTLSYKDNKSILNSYKEKGHSFLIRQLLSCEIIYVKLNPQFGFLNVLNYVFDISSEDVFEQLSECIEKNPGFVNGNFQDKQQVVNFREVEEAVHSFIVSSINEIAEDLKYDEEFTVERLLGFAKVCQKHNDSKINDEFALGKKLFESATIPDVEAKARQIIMDALKKCAVKFPEIVYKIRENASNSN